MQETLLLFSCKELEDGESYLLESMDMRCGSSRHTAAVVSLGVPGLIVYVIGVPAGLMALLWQGWTYLLVMLATSSTTFQPSFASHWVRARVRGRRHCVAWAKKKRL
jgi:hypothetical protein